MWQSFRFVWPLFVCQSLAFSSITQMIFSVAIIGNQIGPSEWATLPIALLPIGTAMGVWPVTKLMARFGRRSVIIAALLFLAAANALTAFAIDSADFILLCLSSYLVGWSLAAITQLRFAAMEIVSPPLQAGAASMVLFGGIIAAVLGPEVGLLTSELFEVAFVGSYLSMSVLTLLAIPFVYVVSSESVATEEHSQKVGVATLLKRHEFLTALSAAAVGYGVMSFVMTATPISMHDHYNHSLLDTKWVIQSHIVAMFLPSLFSAWIISKISLRGMMLAGAVAFLISIGVAFVDQALWGFWISLVLLGIAWNFLFVGGTVLLPHTHSEAEKYTAQGFNDAVVFGVQAASSISAGMLLSLLGWQWMIFACVPLVLWQFWLLRKPLSIVK